MYSANYWDASGQGHVFIDNAQAQVNAEWQIIVWAKPSTKDHVLQEEASQVEIVLWVHFTSREELLEIRRIPMERTPSYEVDGIIPLAELR